jgi:histone acetyltransferase MYST1
LPPHQGKGYGKFLISLSYHLSRLEGVCGSPEKPLSDLGRISYISYWSWIILNILKDAIAAGQHSIQIKEISRLTGFTNTDIIETLNSLSMSKYWKGPQEQVVCLTSKSIDEYLTQIQDKRPLVDVDPLYLSWQPPPSLPSSSLQSTTSNAHSKSKNS